jgi:Bacterial Ig-like domain (group 3)
MNRGGSLRSIVIGALIGMSFLGPATARASSPVTLTLTATPSTAFEDQVVTLSVQTTPVVSGLSITFADTGGVLFQQAATTDDSGVASVTILGTALHLPYTEPVFILATSSVTDTTDAATSNSVELDLSRHPSSVAVTADDGNGNSVVNTVDFLEVRVRVAVATCDGQIQLQSGVYISSSDRFATIRPNPDGSQGCGADFVLGQQPVGTLQFSATYSQSWRNQDSVSPLVDVPITLMTTNTALASSPNPVEAGSTALLKATVSTPKGGGFVSSTGTVTFYDGTTNLGTVPLGQTDFGSDVAPLYVSFPTTGVHLLHATWNGSATATASTSPDDALSVSADVVSATNVGVSSSSLYPVIDGYEDTLSIHGELNEPGSVAITVTNTTTHAVAARFNVPNRGATGWDIVWDGRTVVAPPFVISRHGAPLPSGKIVAAGTYRVTQVITDTLGTKLTVSNDVVLSLKKLDWHTGSTTLAGDHISASGGFNGSVSRSTAYAAGLRLNLSFYTGTPWEAAGYQFTLPSAAVYSAISFAVLGKGTAGAALGLQDRQYGTWAAGHAWIIDDFALASLPSHYAWTTFVGDPANDRIGRTVRGTVVVSGNGDHYDIAEVRLTYRYGILK